MFRLTPSGEQLPVAVATALPPKPATLDTFGGPVRIEWDIAAAMSPLGQAAYFIDFLKASGRYAEWVAGCQLGYTSGNAPKAAEVCGTALLSILSGHSRYAHITALRSDAIMPDLLGMEKIMSEDAMRRGFTAIAENGGEQWLQKHIDRDVEPLLSEPYIIDVDTTVKPLYGRQEGAVVSYNPKKRGRPSHVLHTYFMGGTRLVLGVELAPGNEHTGKHAAPGFWAMIDRRPKDLAPKLVRGDKGIASQSMMQNCEIRGIDFLFKLKMSTNAKKLVATAVTATDWCDVGQGWQGREGKLRLVGWSHHRRVVVMRRWRRDEEKPGSLDEDEQMLLGLAMADAKAGKYEYAILVTSLQNELLSIAQLYRERADCENVFDELKNQWGWGGFTTQDLARCKISAQMVALVYNWWNIFARLAEPDKHMEAITSRPLLLSGIAERLRHARQTTLRVASQHGRSGWARTALERIAGFLRDLTKAAEQLNPAQIWVRILSEAFRAFLNGRQLRPPPRLSAPLHPA